MTEPTQRTLRDALDTDRISDLSRELAALPTGAQFNDYVEDALWRTITDGHATSETQISYADLPSESRSLFGYIETGEDRKLPWWFDQFDWTVTERGDDLTIDSVEDVERLTNYDSDTLTVKKPTHTKQVGRETVADILDQFEDVQTELEGRLDLDREHSDNDLPDEVFEVADRTLRSTSAFSEWFNRLLTYCPPMNTPLTALFLVNTNIEYEAITDLVPEETHTLLNQFVVTDGVVYNNALQQAVERILLLEAPYDLSLPVETDANALEPLGARFYQTWANETTATTELRRWVQEAAADVPGRIEAGEQTQFGVSALTAPLRAERDRPVFTTLNLYAASNSDASYQKSIRDELEEIRGIFEGNGYLNDA